MASPLYPDAALGFRVWVISESGQLQSLISNNFWYQGQNSAQCNSKGLFPHSAPTASCQCGFHAYHRLSAAIDHARALCDVLAIKTVVGAIAGSGKLQIHYDGFRSQMAEPLALLSSQQGYAPDLFKACDYYQIPLLGSEDIADTDNYYGVTYVDDNLKPVVGGKSIQEKKSRRNNGLL